jgi:hypothetical protein
MAKTDQKRTVKGLIIGSGIMTAAVTLSLTATGHKRDIRTPHS